MENTVGTPLSAIYDCFFTKITDDMYMQLTREDTEKLLRDLFLSAIHMFQFPRFNLYDFNLDRGIYNLTLTYEQMNIIATYMVVEWIGQQLATIENIRMKYSGADFKFTSQANHISKLQALKADYERMGFHLQRLYKRRIPDFYGVPRSTMDMIMRPIRRVPPPCGPQRPLPPEPPPKDECCCKPQQPIKPEPDKCDCDCKPIWQTIGETMNQQEG